MSRLCDTLQEYLDNMDDADDSESKKEGTEKSKALVTELLTRLKEVTTEATNEESKVASMEVEDSGEASMQAPPTP